MSHTLTIQPLTTDGLAIDMPGEEAHADLFSALEAAHDQLCLARADGASVALSQDQDIEWTATYRNGDGVRVTITDDAQADGDNADTQSTDQTAADPLAVVRVGDEDPTTTLPAAGWCGARFAEGMRCTREQHSGAWQHIFGNGQSVIATSSAARPTSVMPNYAG